MDPVTFFHKWAALLRVLQVFTEQLKTCSHHFCNSFLHI